MYGIFLSTFFGIERAMIRDDHEDTLLSPHSQQGLRVCVELKGCQTISETPQLTPIIHRYIHVHVCEDIHEQKRLLLMKWRGGE